MIKKRYTLRDTANRRESREYAQTILRSIKDIDFIIFQIQLNIIYNDIDSNLTKRDIKFLKIILITLKNFLEQINDCKYNWWNYVIKIINKEQFDDFID